jgi:hypothetical protein
MEWGRRSRRWRGVIDDTAAKLARRSSDPQWTDVETGVAQVAERYSSSADEAAGAVPFVASDERKTHFSSLKKCISDSTGNARD